MSDSLDRARYEVLRDHVARLSTHVSLGTAVLAAMSEDERARHGLAVADRLDRLVVERAAELEADA